MVKNEREAFKEFADNWGIKEGDRVVTFEDFYAYYSVSDNFTKVHFLKIPYFTVKMASVS